MINLILYREVGYSKKTNNAKINCKIWRINRFISKIYKIMNNFFKYKNNFNLRNIRFNN